MESEERTFHIKGTVSGISDSPMVPLKVLSEMKFFEILFLNTGFSIKVTGGFLLTETVKRIVLVAKILHPYADITVRYLSQQAVTFTIGPI